MFANVSLLLHSIGAIPWAARAEYEDPIDAVDHAVAMRDIASGAKGTLAGAEVGAWLRAETPLAAWRRHRGSTQAARVGIAQSTLAKAETRRPGLNVGTYTRLAAELRTRIEDLPADA
jgi:hypothetical protein